MDSLASSTSGQDDDYEGQPSTSFNTSFGADLTTMDTGGIAKGQDGRSQSRGTSKSHSRPSSQHHSPSANPLPSAASSSNSISTSLNAPPHPQPSVPLEQALSAVYQRHPGRMPTTSTNHWIMATVLDDGTNNGRKWNGPGSCDFCEASGVRCVRKPDAPRGSRCQRCEKDNLECSLAVDVAEPSSSSQFPSTAPRPSTGGRKRSLPGIERSTTNPSTPTSSSALARPPYVSFKSLPTQPQLQSNPSKRPRLSHSSMSSSASGKDKGDGRKRQTSGGGKDERIAEMQRSLQELMKAVEEAMDDDDEGNASSSSEDSETETRRMTKEYRMSLYDPNSTSMSSLLNSPDPSTRSQQQLLISVCKSLKQKEVELNERRALDSEMNRKLDEKDKLLAHERSRRAEAEERAGKAGSGERVEELEREVGRSRLEKEAAVGEAKRRREERDQASEAWEQVGRERDDLSKSFKKNVLEMDSIIAKKIEVEVELAKVQKELITVNASRGSELAALKARWEEEETELKAQVARKIEEATSARGRMSEVEKELQRTRTSRDAAIEASAPRTSEINTLKTEKDLVERQAEARLKMAAEDFTRALNKIQAESTARKLEADKVPDLLKDLALEEKHAKRYKETSKKIMDSAVAERATNLKEQTRLKAKLASLGHPEP